MNKNLPTPPTNHILFLSLISKGLEKSLCHPHLMGYIFHGHGFLLQSRMVGLPEGGQMVERITNIMWMLWVAEHRDFILFILVTSFHPRWNNVTCGVTSGLISLLIKSSEFHRWIARACHLQEGRSWKIDYSRPWNGKSWISEKSISSMLHNQ